MFRNFLLITLRNLKANRLFSLINIFGLAVRLACVILIAWPAAWYFMNSWLESFAYRTPMNIGIFVFAGVLAWLIASLTVGSLAAITANINPTLSLRHE